MQFFESFRKCVVFLIYRTQSGDLHSGGTGFFVSMPLPGFDPQAAVVCYLVTARHVVDAIVARAVDGKILIRANTEGGVELLEAESDEWHFPSDPRIDLAAIPVALRDGAFHRTIYSGMFATQDVLMQQEIGIGAELFVVGLFTRHAGTGRNIPILRSGIISVMPEEKVKTKMGQMDAFLVELRSIGGLSGSPVFVRLGPFLQREGSVSLSGYSYYLLGAMHGHWSFESDGVLTDGVFDDEKLNTGIGVVVPADAILELLNNEELSQARKQLADSLLATNSLADATQLVGLLSWTPNPETDLPDQ